MLKERSETVFEPDLDELSSPVSVADCEKDSVSEKCVANADSERLLLDSTESLSEGVRLSRDRVNRRVFGVRD